MSKTFKVVIGRAEAIDFVDYDTIGVPAKIDTGAYSSSVWASNIRVSDNILEFELFGKGHENYTGDTIRVKSYKQVTIQNSFGKSESRYGIEMNIRFCGKRVKTFFTLADRSKKIYPVLIGRKLLKGRFLVDVATGHPIADEETEETLGFKGLKNRVRKSR